MANNDFLGEDSVNFYSKWLCVLLIDVSVSMSDEALLRVNEEIRDFLRFIEKDEMAFLRMELCVMTFGQDVITLQEPAQVNSFAIPKITRNPDVFHAVNYAVEKIKARKFWYKETGQTYYRPLLVLITCETNNELLQCDTYASIRKDVFEKRYRFLNYGMNDSNISLSSILTTSHPWYEDPEMPLLSDDTFDLEDTSWSYTFAI